MARGRKKDKHILGRMEMRIMGILWDAGSATCREVFTRLGGDKEYAYTTVLSMMKHLEKKGVVQHTEDGRAFVYSPTVEREHVEERMLSDFVDSVFFGSASSLVNSLLNTAGLDDRDLEEIEEAIRKLREERGDA